MGREVGAGVCLKGSSGGEMDGCKLYMDRK